MTVVTVTSGFGNILRYTLTQNGCGGMTQDSVWVSGRTPTVLSGCRSGCARTKSEYYIRNYKVSYSIVILVALLESYFLSHLRIVRGQSSGLPDRKWPRSGEWLVPDIHGNEESQATLYLQFSSLHVKTHLLAPYTLPARLGKSYQSGQTDNQSTLSRDISP